MLVPPAVVMVTGWVDTVPQGRTDAGARVVAARCWEGAPWSHIPTVRVIHPRG